jgi:hypothetical protein
MEETATNERWALQHRSEATNVGRRIKGNRERVVGEEHKERVVKRRRRTRRRRAVL